MKQFAPKYFSDFRCIAAACPDSCCKEWAVDVDGEAARLYRTLPGPLGDRLRQVLRDTEDGVQMEIENGRCPMWRQDGLCRIQAELGHDALCKTCREFPRIRHDYGDFVELGLELSCPEAARMILSGANSTWLEAELPGETNPEYDPDVLETLLRSREQLLSFWRSAALPLPQALAVLLLYAHEVQAEIDGGERATLDPEVCLADARKYAVSGDLAGLYRFYQGLEVLTPQWRELLTQAPRSDLWPEELTHFVPYLICRYWLQAVSDYDIVCRAKFLVSACLLVKNLGGEIQKTAQLFSKEIENDPDNVEAILDAAYQERAFTDGNLLGLLLS